MPLTRYQIRNEFSLADPDLYRAADKDDAEDLLEGVAMAGLVGVLRQLGDLAEFAAEIFHDLHEEVMATSARGHTLMVRVQQLEAEVPALEKEFLSRTNHSSFYTNAGVYWHPNLHMEQNLITQGDLPRCVMDSYEECWGPPRLFLLDKFDVAGAGACLKRYTDPSFFKNERDTFVTTHLEVQREKKTRKSKKKGSRWKNADAESVATSHAKLHQLFLEESIENVFSDPARLVKLKKRHFNGSPLDPKSGKSYMEKFLETTSPDIDPAIYERAINLPPLKMTSENSSESGLEIVEIRTVSPKITLAEAMENTSVSADEQDMARNASVENLNSDANNQANFVMGEPAAANDMYGALHGSPTVKVNVIADGCKYKRRDFDGDRSDDITSEVENFMDALATIDSEIETDNEGQSRNDLHLADKKYRAYSDVNAEQLESHAHSSDSQSFGISYISDYGDSSSKKSQSSFSSSDSISNVTENIASDDETHSQKCKTDKLHASRVSLATDVEKTQGSNSDKIHEDQLHCNGEVSSISSLTDTSGASVEMKPRENSVIDLPLEHKLCREPSSNIKLSSDKYTTNKNDPNVPDSSAVSSDLSANFIFSGNLQLNESNVGGKSISSDALMHQTETMKPDLHSENGDSSLDKAKPLDSAEEVCVANPGNLMACSQEFVVMDAKGLLNCSTMAESEDCLGRTVVDNMLDDTILAQPDFEIGATVEASTESENVAELVHIPMSHKTIEQKLSDASSGVSNEKVGYSNFVREVDLEKVSREVDNGESGNSSIKVDDREESPAASDTAANWQDDSGNKDHVVSDETLTEDRPDDTATSTTVAIGSDISGNLSSDSIHSVLVDPAANCHDGSGNNDHIVSDEPLTEDRPDDISTSTTVANGSDISGTASSDSIHSVLVDPVVSGKSLSDAGDPHQPEMEVITENVSPSLTKSERRCDEAHVPAVESDSEELVSVLVGFYNLKGNVQSLAPGEQIDTPASDEGVCLESPDPYAQSNVLPAVCLRESREYLTAASLSSQLSEPGTCSIQSPDIPIDQLNDGSASRNEVTAVAPEVSAQSSDLGVNSNELETNPSTFSPSPYALLDDTSKARAEEAPPLPPLPPMQWRMMKADQFFQASHNDLSKNDKGLLPVLSQCSTEKKAQYEPSVSEVGTVMPWHLFLPEASEEVKQPYDSGKVGHNYALPTLGEPDCLNNGDEEFSGSSNPFLTEPGHSKETHECRSPTFEQDVQSSNPALPLLIDEATFPEHESSSLFEYSLQTSLDNSMDATSEGNSVQHGLQEREELVQDHLDTSITQPSTFEEQPPNTVEEQSPKRVEQQPPTQVEENTSKIEEDSSDEVGKHPQNDDKVQLPIEFEEHSSKDAEKQALKDIEENTSKIEEDSSDEVSMHPQNDDKMQLPIEFEEHTSKDAEKQALKDIEDQPCAQAELKHPPEAEKQSQHGILTSGEDIPQMYSAYALPGLSTSETFFPPHSLALLPINEAGKPNGHPTVKLPRPRNPLIDAVAAVDKSKMRKVTDRVQPPVGQKADERDSLLEQIRKKSFNLKPTVGTRPSIQNIQGPRTNLRLAAILEKANAIRQATAGSDEDEDSWSDS